jgi:hypothetical protein
MQVPDVCPAQKGLIVVTTLFCVVILATACQVCRVSSSFSSIAITNLGVCKGIGSDGEPVGISNTFPVDSNRIYAFFTLDSKMSVRLKVRWYYQGELILEYEDLYQPGLNYSWIERQGFPSFEVGEYRVEVAGETVHFKVERSGEDDTASHL